MTKHIFQLIGVMVVARLVFGVVFSLVGSIPAVKTFNQKRSAEASLVLEKQRQVVRENVKNQVTLQPIQKKYGELMMIFQTVQSPIGFFREEPSMPFAYDSLSRCEWAKKLWTAMSKEELSCVTPSNS